MKNTLTGTLLSLLVLCGCHFGERGARRIIEVQFLASTNRTMPELSYSGPEVQGVFAVLDAAVVGAGLARDEPMPRPPSPDGNIGGYLPIPRSRDLWCSVFLRHGALSIQFAEGTRWNPSPEVKRLSEKVAKELRAHFGESSIRVKVRSST
jgi:hypothetical protein